jgi:hypothetical protein
MTEMSQQMSQTQSFVVCPSLLGRAQSAMAQDGPSLSKTT